MPVWSECHYVPAGYGVEALVHLWMVPSIGGRHSNSERGGSNDGATEGRIYECWGGFNVYLERTGRLGQYEDIVAEVTTEGL